MTFFRILRGRLSLSRCVKSLLLLGPPLAWRGMAWRGSARPGPVDPDLDPDLDLEPDPDPWGEAFSTC